MLEESVILFILSASSANLRTLLMLRYTTEKVLNGIRVDTKDFVGGSVYGTIVTYKSLDTKKMRFHAPTSALSWTSSV